MFGHDDDHKDEEQDEITKIDVAMSGGGVAPSSPSDTPIVSGPPPTNDNSSTNSNSVPSIDNSSSNTSTGSDDLLDLKKEALEKLSPLVGHLDQTPEEKFHTTMMMIQATDNQDLVKQAYEAANNIPDEKAKAQALLDVINEINYFTQPHDKKD